MLRRRLIINKKDKKSMDWQTRFEEVPEVPEVPGLPDSSFSAICVLLVGVREDCQI